MQLIDWVFYIIANVRFIKNKVTYFIQHNFTEYKKVFSETVVR